MADSPDFFRLFKIKFQLKHLGLWWAQPRTKLRGGTDFNRSKFALHVEIDNEDSDKIQLMKDFFSHSSKKVDSNMLGVPMTFVPTLSFQCDDEDKRRIVENSKSQEHLGTSIKSTTINGINLNNWFSKKKRCTLLRKFPVPLRPKSVLWVTVGQYIPNFSLLARSLLFRFKCS